MSIADSVQGAPATLVGMLRERASAQPLRCAFTYLVGGEGPELRVTYAELDAAARALAARLQQSASAGDRVLLLYPHGLEFIEAFFGALYAGMIAVPAPAPGATRRDRSLPRLTAIAEDCEPAVILSTTELAPAVDILVANCPMLSSAQRICTNEIPAEVAQPWQEPTIDGSTLAYLQYTSGSTSQPKGVMVTHRNVLHNEAMIQRVCGNTESTVGLGWLPFFHDMGLIGTVLQPVYAGFNCVLMPPASVLQRPLRWLRAMSQFEVHGTAAPDFAYALCTERIHERELSSLDLSNWRVAINGAEPIRAATLDRFSEKFAACGFRPEAFLPCYGLAEATLMVTSITERDAPQSVSLDRDALTRDQVVFAPDNTDALTLIGNGPCFEDPQVAIVDPETLQPCPSGRVGEIWVSGTSVAAGYWRKTDATHDTFHATSGEDGSTHYLRTGDLGFLHAGQLYVTGRLKDVIIVRGSNHYPQDVETTIQQSHAALSAARCAAFPVDVDGTERLVIVSEVDRHFRKAPEAELQSIVTDVRREVASRHGVDPHAVQLTVPGSVPVTSSGKIQRQACRRNFEQGNLRVISSWTDPVRGDARLTGSARDEPLTVPVLMSAHPSRRRELLQLQLRQDLSDLLQVPMADLDSDVPVTRFGLDSMTAFALLDRVESRFDVRLPISMLIDEPSLSGLAEEILGMLQQREPAPDAVIVRRANEANPSNDAEFQADGLGSRDAIEAELCQLWSTVLDVRHVGTGDNFFELGGHSLSATQLITRIRETFEVELPFRDLFETPTVAAIAEQIRQRQRDSKRKKILPAIRPVARNGEPRLSFAQQRLWFVDRLSAHDALHNVPTAVRLGGDLQLDALESAIREIVARHETLRTTFATVDGRPLQIIGDEPKLAFRFQDLRDESDSQSKLAEVFRNDAKEPFDLERGPLLRVTLLQLGAIEHAMLLSMHHIISDIWSMGVFLRELSQLYEAFCDGKPSPLPALPVQMADFAEWQREWYDDASRDADLEYWKRQLAALPVLQLPTDRPRGSVPSYRGATLWFAFPAQLREALDDLSREEGVTPFMALLTAFQVLLCRYSGQTDVVVGTPIAGRTRSEIEDLIGCFINSLALRGDLSGDPTFREALHRVRETCLGAYAHQELPFEKLVEELQPQRDLSREPLFQVMLVHQNAPLPKRQVGDLSLSILECDAGTSRFDLTLFFWDWTETLSGQIEYSTDLFDESTIRRLLDHLRTLLESATADPAQRISQLPILAEPERRQVLSTWSQTEGEAPPEVRIDELIASQAQRTPEATAVRLAGQQLSYQQLNERSNQLAHALQERSAGPDVPIAICVEPSIEMLVGILGVLKAGAAYVPIDPTIPINRKRFILNETQPPVVLTQERCVAGLPESPATVVRLDGDWGELACHPHHAPQCAAGPDHLAYVIYTSGSSGPPKGVMVSHRSVVHSTWARMRYYDDPVHCFLLLSSFAFDSSVAGLFWTLCQGGTLSLAGRDDARDPSRILELIEEDQVSHVLALPALYALILDRAQASHVSSLKTVIVAGEVCPSELVRHHHETFPYSHLFNEYGPTEGAVWATVYWCVANDGDISTPVGRPIPGTRAYVLDENQTLLGPGIPGELCIGGPGLARGYLNHPELTAEKFIPDPFAAQSGQRIYRTGDRCRWSSDGQIEFLGRIDRQIKIRGYRIEPTEVEAALAAHADIREVAVVPRGDAATHSQLVAYFTVEAKLVPTGSELRRFLRDLLPGYMVPAAFVHMDDLPLTATGKIDREALPKEHTSRPELDADFVAPQTETQKRLASIWCEILGIERVGIYDNLFELGGHSLLAAQMVTRIVESFRVDLPLREFFETPTVAGLAEAIEVAERCAVAPPIERADRDQELPLSFAQQRLWFVDQLSPGDTNHNIPLAVRVTGAIDVEAFRLSLNEVVRRHEVLRTTFTAVQGRPVQVIHPTLEIDLPLVDLTSIVAELREAAAHEHARADVSQPFSLETGPLLRAKVLRLGDADHVLLLTMHHIVSDGWSLQILIDEMASLYQDFREGHTPSLAGLPIQYADFSAWQHQWLQGDALEGQLTYWRKQLAGVQPLELPIDRPRPAEPRFQAANCSFELSAEVSRELKRLADGEGATMFMTLLTAFKVLLFRYSGQDDLAVGCPIANRNRSEIEGLIGFFVNVLVLRSDLSGNPQFRELLSRVRDVALAGYAHQDLPCEKIVEELQPDRDLRRGIVQAAFAFENLPVETANVAGLALHDFQVPMAMVKCDLSLTMWETDDRLSGTFEFDRELFDEETITALTQHFESMLEAAVAEPDARILDLPFPAAEQRDVPRPSAATAVRTNHAARLSPDDEMEQVAERTNLTRNQVLIWAGQKLFEGVPLYNSAVVLTIDKHIDRDRFERAFARLIEHSDAMRTVIEEVDGLPRQRVLSQLPFDLDYHDFSAASDPRADVAQWVRERSRLCFDLHKQLFDTALIKLADEQFAWYFNQHHIISDGRSIELVCRFVERAYRVGGNGKVTGRNGDNDKIAADWKVSQFQDYVEFERADRHTSAYGRAKQYWQDRLCEKSLPIEFYGRSGRGQSTRTVAVSEELGSRRTEAIKSLADKSELATLGPHLARFVVFASALFAYLQRLSGQRTLSIGTPVLNRPGRKFANTIGLCMHMVPLRVTVAESETFGSLLDKVTQATLEAIEHQRYAVRNPPAEPVYNVVLNYRPGSRTEFDGASVHVDEIPTGEGFDALSVVVRDHGDAENFALDFQFGCEAFDSEHQQQTTAQLVRVLDLFLEAPELPLRQVELLSDAERGRLLGEFSGRESAPPDPVDASVFDFFAAQVRRTPQAAAVQSGDEALSYRDLHERSSRLAQYLRTQGVGPDVPVGLCSDRSLDWIVGVLGILKAGGAYVPLDPAYPRDRLQYMLNCVGAPLVLAQQRWLDLVQHAGARTLCLDSDWYDMPQQGEVEDFVLDPQSVAYIVFTSGSTGSPNAVAVPHAALASYVQAAIGLFEISSTDRVLQFASIGFDTAAEEIFPTLACGATLVLRSAEMIDSPAGFLSECNRLGITVLDLPTAYWHEITSALPEVGGAVPPALRLVVIGGEQARWDCLETWWKQVDRSVRLVNTYGPTEATIVSSFCDLSEPAAVSNNQPDPVRQVPIGRPIATSRLYVVDSQLRPVPIGMVGELCIAGEGLARGYLGQPQLTAARFVPNPFADDDGSRLYKTGDRCRFRPDGTLDFIGRDDDQVKIRGHRIELGEIEAALIKHPAIGQAVVNVHARGEGEPQLVAYAVTDSGAIPSAGELRQFLQNNLPDYMLPALFVSLESLPLSRNGKIDRRALPQPTGERPDLGHQFEAPRTDIQEKLASLWCDVLGLDRIGIDDNFFELGGHSLLATQIIARARETFEVDLSLRRLFESPTIAAMAELIEQAEQGSRLPPIERVSRRSRLPLSYAQERLWFLDQLMAGSVSYNMPATIRVSGPLDMRALRRAVNEIVRRHEVLRTTFTLLDDEPVQSIARELLLPVTVEDLSDLTDADRHVQLRRLIDDEASRPFDLTVGPLIRPRVIRMDEDDHVLMLTMHHIVSDGWSIGVFIRELAALYSEFVTGAAARLPELPLQYADYAAWQREWLSGEVLETQLAYWKTQLADLPTLDLPIDHMRPATGRFRARTFSHQLPRELTRSLRQLSEHEGSTPFMTLLAGFQVLLSRYSGQVDFAIGSPTGSRQRSELEGLIGLFVNTLVLRADLSGDPSFSELLDRVRRVCLEAYSHQDVPFERLVQELSPQRKLQDTPLFRVLFNFNAYEPEVGDTHMFGLKVESLIVEGESKFDLTLYVGDNGGQIDLGFTYNADIFDSETIAEFSRNFQLLLEAAVDEPQQPLSQLAFGRTESQQSLIAGFSESLGDL